MYNWVVRRKIERTSAPQPVYPAQVDAGVRLWMPAIALAVASFVTPAHAKVDVRYDTQPAASGWIQPNLPTGPTTAQVWPAVLDKGQSSVTAKRAVLDVRGYRWDSDFGYDDSATTAIWTPVNNPISGQTPKRAQFDVRSFEWSPSSAWIFPSLPTGPTVAQQWPAVLAGSQPNYVTGARPDFDVRVHDSRIDAGSFATVYSGILRRYAPAFSSELDSYRLRDGVKLDVRSYDWAPQPAWIFTNLPSAVTVAQTWPAILAGSQPNYRTADRARLDVQAYEWRSDAPFVQAASVAIPTWAGVFGGELASFRTADRPRLNVRGFDWAPEPAWIFTNLPAAVTVAQTWPALQENLGTQYRTSERARLDVRRYDWAPAFTWVRPVVDATVAKWAPTFAAELASFRTNHRARLDVRVYVWHGPASGWIFVTKPNFFAFWLTNLNQEIGPTPQEPSPR